MIDTERKAPMSVEEVIQDVAEEADWTLGQALAHVYSFIEAQGLTGRLHDYLERRMVAEAGVEQEEER